MRCDWAACRQEAVTKDRGWSMCQPHYTEHLALLREEAQRPCASCAVPFVSTNPRRLLCTNCQRASRRAS